MSSIINFILKIVITFHLVSFLILTDTVNSKEIVLDGDNIEISLKNYTRNGDYILPKNIILEADASVTINVIDVPKEISFVLLQVHAYQYSLTLKYTNKTIDFKNINGTNIGLIRFKSPEKYIFYLSNYNNFSVSTMIVAVGYPINNPIPGGCAMESPIPIAPQIDINYNNSIITVQCGPADLLYKNTSCVYNNKLEYTFYHMFMPEDDFTEDTYFSSILKMITYDKIIENSIVAPQFPIGSPLQRKFSSYSKIGTIYTVTVKSNYDQSVSVYIPAVTYSCDTPSDPLQCSLGLSLFGKIAIIILMIFESLIIYYGRKLFFIELFANCMLAGGFISYMFLTRNPDYDLFMIASAIGFASGLIWTAICICKRSPLLTYFIPIYTFSFLLTAIIFSIYFGDKPLFESGLNYWSVFISISLLILIICLFTFPIIFYAIANWTICAFILIIGFGVLNFISSIPYVIINVIRRATVDGFNETNTVLPFQYRDKILLVIASLIIVFRGYKFLTRDGAPFPAIPRLYRIVDDGYLEI